ncbi:hypothetical protein Tco_1204859 [Tanacetum coccineum]
MHNNIMTAGSRDRPPMLAMGIYAQKEAIHLLLTGIGDEMYSTIDACKTAHDMWIAIERLQQREYLNKQDVKTNLFWEFGRFTLRYGESIESYYSLFYKMMNEMQTVDLDKESYHKLFDILKQYQKEVNEIRAEKIAKNANPLALIAKPITPPSQSASEKDNDPEQAQRDKDMQKNLALIAKYFKKIYKPTNNNLKTSSNSKNKNVDTFPRYKNVNDNQTEQADWLEDTDEEIDEQELKAHYSFMVKIKEVLPADLGSDAKPLENVQYDAEYNVFANERQHSEQPESINNTCVQKQLKKANASLSHELQECKSALEACKSSLGESNRTRDRYLVALHDKEVELQKYKILKNHTIENDKLKSKLKETLGLLAQKEHDIQEGLKIKAYEISVIKEKHDELVKQSLLTKSSYEGLLKEKNKIVQLILFIVDSGCTKHMTGNLKGFVQGNITVKRVYYVEVLNHNLFSVGQFYDADLEVAFRKSTCFVRDL